MATAKRQVRIKRNQLLKRKDDLIDQYLSIIISDKRSYFLKAIKIDHINFEGRNMRNQKLIFPFMSIEEVIMEEPVK